MSFAIWQQNFILFLLVSILIIQTWNMICNNKEKKVLVTKEAKNNTLVKRNRGILTLKAVKDVTKLYESVHTANTNNLLKLAQDMQDEDNPLLESPIIRDNIKRLEKCAEFSTFQSFEIVHKACTREIWNATNQSLN